MLRRTLSTVLILPLIIQGQFAPLSRAIAAIAAGGDDRYSNHFSVFGNLERQWEIFYAWTA